MSTQSVPSPDINQQLTLKEYSLLIDGVIEISDGEDPTSFFAGLLDAIIEYVEQHEAQAGLTMSHQAYIDEDEGVGVHNGTTGA